MRRHGLHRIRYRERHGHQHRLEIRIPIIVRGGNIHVCRRHEGVNFHELYLHL